MKQLLILAIAALFASCGSNVVSVKLNTGEVVKATYFGDKPLVKGDTIGLHDAPLRIETTWEVNTYPHLLIEGMRHYKLSDSSIVYFTYVTGVVQ